MTPPHPGPDDAHPGPADAHPGLDDAPRPATTTGVKSRDAPLPGYPVP